MRNEDYNSAPPFAQHQGPAHIKNLEWQIVPEDSTRYGLLRAGPQLHFYRRLERFLDWYLM